MPCDYSKYPSNFKTEIRPRILKRAEHQCESCGVPNYAVGYRDADKRFVPACGNGPFDAAGKGQNWPELQRLTAKEAGEFVHALNNHRQGKVSCDADGNHWFFIVLTIAHVSDADPGNCQDNNLAAWCQACHNQHDAPMRAKNAALTRAMKKPVVTELQNQLSLQLEII